jgi:hypothetical protein
VQDLGNLASFSLPLLASVTGGLTFQVLSATLA